MTQQPRGVIILLYHNILPAGSALTADQQSIPFDLLQEHLKAMQRAGFEPLSLENAFEQLVSQTSEQHPPKFAVTFDDAYESLVEHLPLLDSTIRPAVFFLMDYAGKSNLTWNTRSPVVHRHMTLAQARELVKVGIDFELHGTDHHNLVKFDRDELRRRFQRGAAQFQEQFDRAPRFLSYPYGCCNEDVRAVAAEFFQGAFSVTHGAWWGEKARYAVNRFSVPSFLSGDDLVEVVCADPAQRWYECERRAPWRS